MSRHGGSIELVTGPMFCGKSSYLADKIERYTIAKRKCIALKWKGDTRYTDQPYIVTHSGIKCECIPCDNDDLKTIYTRISAYDIICVDEGAFFKDIVNFCEMLANNGHTVIVASLIGTFQREGFNDILNLIPKCEKITMLSAICMKCFSEGAAFTKRTVGSSEIELVGGAESYIAICRECFMKE